jgi:beta-lactamase class A
MKPILLCLLAAAAVWSQPTVAELLEARLVRQLQAEVDSYDGVAGVAVVDLVSGHRFAIHGQTVFPQASSIKIPLAVAILRGVTAGRFSLDAKMTLQPAEAVGGSGWIAGALRKGPVTLTGRELLRAMITASDNTATNKWIALVGMEEVNRLMDRFGLPHTRLGRRMMDAAAARAGRENVSTPEEMARLMELIHTRKALDEERTAELLGILQTVEDDTRRAIPDEVDVATKPGAVPGVYCETSLVLLSGRPFALSVMATFAGARRSPVGPIAGRVYDYFERLSKSNIYGNRLQ